MNYGTSKNPLDSPDLICMIVSKVPGHLQDRWKRYIWELGEQKQGNLLLDLTNFIEDEMIVISYTLLSREAVGQYDENPPRPQKF